MAVEYSIDIASDLNRDQAMRLLAERLGMEQTEGFVHKPGTMSIGACDIEPGHWTEVTEEAFHFTPNLSMSFRRLYEANGEEFARLMLRATMLLLEHGRDAVLLFNGEIIVFQRLRGQLTFNTDYELQVGKDELLLKEEVRIPYERRSLPSPLL